MKKKRIGPAIILGTLFVALLVWQSVQATRCGYQVERSRRRARELQARIAELQVEWEHSVAPAQLVVKARKQFGMHPAEPSAIRLLGPVQPSLHGPS